MKLQIVLFWVVGLLLNLSAHALNAPTSLSVSSVNQTVINLSWSDNSTSETGFIIQRSLNAKTGFVEIAKLGSNSVVFSNTGLVPNTTYYYKIRSYRNRSGSVIYSTFSNIVSVTTAAVVIIDPPPPSSNTGRIYGVTISNPWNQMPAIIESLSAFSFKPTSRIVFDEFVPASEYKPIVDQVQSVSYVMGEILDSYYVPQYTVQAYQSRVTEYLNTLGSAVDIWEIGNEINGEWLGDTASVTAKMSGAYDIVKSANKSAALTLYYNKGCFEKADHEMFTWAQANVPARMKSGLDYVFISFYEDDCNGIQPDWNQVFSQLGSMFPNSKIGFGENGTVTASKKAMYIDRYYRMTVNHPRFVHGNFWWYFDASQNGGPGDMVPQGNALWTVINDAMVGK